MPPGKIEEKAGLHSVVLLDKLVLNHQVRVKKEELVSSQTRQKNRFKFENLTHKGSQTALSKIFNTIPTCVP